MKKIYHLSLILISLSFAGCNEVKEIFSPITSFFDSSASVEKEDVQGFFDATVKQVSNASDEVKNKFKTSVQEAEGMIQGYQEDISDGGEGFFDATVKKVSNASDGVKNTLKLSSYDNILEGSTSAVYKNGHLAIGYEDGSIEITNSNGKEKRIYPHKSKVNNLYIVEDKLISSSHDGSLAEIDLSNIKILKKMKGHGRSVEGIVAFDNLIFSISKDRTIKIWEISSTGLSRIIYY